ncbi:heavy metal translocating P-type ATPase [Campylobacter sp.]|uniref:heavy metal translocating P-type ATPase n=1 Tax=Campylobacter sp. TaxID=205 RepID=UPI0026FB0F8F|nr:heavy metal translocating P-type ATPase metal-binding domain-containing protein [Campylobacter sp.]
MSKTKCAHCRQSFEDSVMIESSGNKFCCNGCKSVFEILTAKGLDEFYSRLGKNVLNPAKEFDKDDRNLELAYQNYIKNENGFSKISLVIEGIHCSACIWLNEKVLFNTKGILEVNINAVNNKATIVWDESEINLAQILSLIRSIGYDAYAYDPSRQEERISSKRREFYAKLLVGIFATMNIMWLSVAKYGGYFTGIRDDVKAILSFAEFVLSTPVLFYTGSDFFKGALAAIKNRTQNMDLLIVSGALAAYIFSIYSMFSRSGEVYFDSVAMIITFVFIGKYLEILSKKRACDTLDSLNSMVASKVSVKIGDKTELKDVNEVKIGDVIVIRAGERALIDGVISSGSGSFDYSSLTGESAAVFKERGDELSSGSICLDGFVEYASSAKFSDSTLSKIINLLENATLKKPHIQKLADEISSKFSSVIMLLSAVTFCFWLWYAGSFEAALIVGISVIVIACPCALGLATPVSTLVGLGVGFKTGVIFKEAKVLENLAKCDVIVFDKTGTLTTGKLCVDKFESFIECDINLIYSLAKSSTHPVSKGVCEYLEARFERLKILDFQDLKIVEAKGVCAQFSGVKICGGSERFMQDEGVKIDRASKSTNYYFAVNGKLAAKFELSDKIRDGATRCIKALKQAKFKIIMLTGDNEFVAKKVANELDIKEFKANCLPIDKANFIENLTKNGKKVVMVGDGINDALALSYANVAVCLGSGADVSLDKSDVVLMGDNLNLLKDAVLISKRTFKAINQNLIFSLVYNALTIPLAMAGYVVPVVAAVSMSLSSIVVVLNSMRIKSAFKERL